MYKGKDKESLKEFGKNLKRIRKSKKLSLRGLALICAIDHAEIGRYERGEVNLTYLKMPALAEGLDVHLSELVPGGEPKSSLKRKSKGTLTAFGKNLTRIRKRKKLSIRKLAQNCTIDYADIGKYEQGENFTYLTMLELAEALDVHPSELIPGGTSKASRQDS